MTLESKSPTISIALCIDRTIIPGAHVTLYSTRRSLDPHSHLEVFLITDGLTDADVDGLHATLQRAGGTSNLHLEKINQSQFRDLKWIGGYMAYSRLLLGDVIPRSRVLYLDADLVVSIDLSEVFHWDLAGNVIGAVAETKAGRSNDAEMHSSFGHDPESRHFNTGLLVIDLDEWRNREYTRRSLRFARQYGKNLRSADQTVLNMEFNGQITRLPFKFNMPLNAADNAPRDLSLPGVYHLIGRPKPWDPFGSSLLNAHSRFFEQHLKSTGAGRTAAPRRDLRDVSRALRMARSYLNCFRARMRRNITAEMNKQ